ncbi:unnamed protein product [Anisakis simplex]|uniref:RGS domain-containing protein n=1 Tax=Anisakis simplex TaxID=6269 RepID=A0A158PPE2_ANISI|nr:unnamed protein product [Anisakis simplex]
MQTINRANETELASVQFFIDAPFTICDSFVSRLKAEEQVKRCPHNLWHNGAFLIIFFAVLIIGSGRRVDDGLKWIFYHSPDISSPNLDLRIYGIILSVFSLPGFTLFIKAGILTYYVFRSSLELQFVDKLAIYLCAAITMLFMLLQSPSALRNIRRDRQLRSEMKLMIENENKGETPHNKDELIDNEVIGHLGKLTEGYQSVKRAEIIRKMNGERLNSKDLCSAIHFLDEDSRDFYKVLFGGFSEELTKYYGDMHKEASSKGAEFYGRLVRKLLRDELYLFDFFNDLDTAHEMLKIFNKELIEPQRQQEMSGDLEYVAYMRVDSSQMLMFGQQGYSMFGKPVHSCHFVEDEIGGIESVGTDSLAIENRWLETENDFSNSDVTGNRVIPFGGYHRGKFRAQVGFDQQARKIKFPYHRLKPDAID